MSHEIRDLIRQISIANPLWGAPPIHGELLKLGIAVSQATVGRYMPWRPKVPSPTWRSFLHNHMSDTAAIDMFVVVTATFHLLYALIVLGHDRRRIEHFNVMSRRIQPKSGWRAKSPKRFPGTVRPAFCCEIATLHMVRPSAIGSRRWQSKRSLPLLDRRGRMPMSNASSARSAASVSTTSSSLMNITCAECCRLTFSITVRLECTFRSAKIARSLGRYSQPLQAPLSRFHRSAACIIATSGAQPEPFAVTEPVP